MGLLSRSPRTRMPENERPQVFVKSFWGSSSQDSVVRAFSEKKNVCPNIAVDKALVLTDEWKVIRAGFPCWTGTMAAYAEPGQLLGGRIEYFDKRTGFIWILPVPEEYRGERDVILVIEYPGYFLEPRANIMLVNAVGKVSIVRDFPASDGWCLPERLFGIPRGDFVGYSRESRYLLRTRSSRVGPIARGRSWVDYGDKRYVDIDTQPSAPMGLLIQPGTSVLVNR